MITLHDKTFKILIKAADIDKEIHRLASELNRDLADQKPIFLAILNGSFMFASDLMKLINIPGTEIHFAKLSSYQGTSSTGNIKELIGCDKELKGRTVIILEDIIDSGLSMQHIISQLQSKGTKKILTATLFFKPKALRCEIPVDYCGIELENDFVIGRGMDYNDLGRNLPDLYVTI